MSATSEFVGQALPDWPEYSVSGIDHYLVHGCM
jgi:hypothetical protein